MLRIAYAVLTGLAGAVFIHLVIIFLIPIVAGGRTYAALATVAAESGTAFVLPAGRVDPDGGSVASEIVGGDPLFATRVCAFDLSAGSFRVRSASAPEFFSLSVLNNRDQVVFSLVDRLAFANRIDLEILAKSEEGRYRLRQRAELANPGDALPVFVDGQQGLVVVRAFVPDATYSRFVTAFLSEMTCETIAFSGG
jgi:uncharacterized membrane protein